MEEVNVGIVGLGNVGSGTLAILAENADADRAEARVPAEGGRRVQPLGAHQGDSRGARRRVQDHRLARGGGASRRADRGRTGGRHRTWPREIIDAAIAQPQVRGHRQQGTDGRLRPGDLGPRHPRRHQPGDGGQRVRRHPHPRGAARGHLGRPRDGALRHPQRHLQLHPHRDGKARRAARGACWRKRRRWAMRRPTPAPISTASTRAPSWCCWRPWRSARRSRPSDIFMEGIRRISPLDFRYARQLKHTIRLICGARKTPDGLILFVRPGADSADRPSWPACRAPTTRCG